MKKKNYLFLWILLFIFLTTYSFNSSQNTQFTFLPLKKIQIEGANNSDNKKIAETLDQFKGKSIIFVNRYKMNRSINNLQFIKELKIKKIYPDTVRLEIIEYKPIGIYFFNEKYFVFDENGKIIDQIYITDFTHQSLLIFKGKSANLKANSLINILKNNDFKKKYQIESLEFINKRRWDINLYSNVKLMLSEEDPNKSIQNFIMIQNKLSETDINNIKTYDLRNLKKTILINLND